MRIAVVLLVLVLAAVFCLSPLAEVDFFWHLLAGRQILDTGQPPRADTFTYTSAGRPWTDLHWLFQAGAAWVERRGGFAALDLLKIALVVGAFAAALAAAAARRATLAAAALAVPGLVAAQERFTLRPEIASFALLGFVLLILARREGSPRGLALLPPLLALWANLHALYAVGLATLALVLAGDGFERWRGARGISLRPLTLALAVAVPCTLLTPYGFGGWVLPRTLLVERVAAGNLYGRSIAEFQAPFSGFGRTASIAAFAALMALVVAALVLGSRACRPADLLLVAAFMALALMARRNMPLFALVAIAAAAPAAAAAWHRGLRALAGRGRAGARLAAVAPGAALLAVAGSVAVLVVDVAGNRFFARDGTQRSFGVGIAPSFFPERAADIIAAAGLDGEVLNDLTMGGYLEWRWVPGRRAYIDGRLEVHPPELFAAYLRLQQDPGAFEEESRARGIRAVVWSHQQALEAAPLLRHLAAGNGWHLAHIDLAAAIFVRDGSAASAGPPSTLEAVDLENDPPAARLLAAAEAAAARVRAADPLPGRLRRLLPRVEIPAAETGAALFFAIIGRPSIAEPLLRDAARRAPWSAILRYDLGLVLAQAGRPAEAAAAFADSLAIDPGFTAARVGLALMSLRAGDADGALREWARAEQGGPLPPAARQARGALLAARGRIDEAIGDYRSAVRDDPGRADWFAELALLYAGRGMDGPARDAIRRARAIDPKACRPRVAEARILRAAGDTGAAEAALRSALADDPACAEARDELMRIAGAPALPESR
jgi:tetratricopeptide (TPR) repeat protein